MSQVVQATCPGCKSVLRIPKEWINQPIRCKACGTVIKTKKASSNGSIKSSPAPLPFAKTSSDTPVPGTRSGIPPLPPPPPQADKAIRSAEVPVMPTLPVSAPAPLAAPVHTGTSAFAFDEPELDHTPRQRRKRSGGGGLLVGLSIFMVLLLGVGGLAFAFKDQLRTAIRTKGQSIEHGEGANAGITKKETGGQGGSGQFPRRAMIVSVHNYLYANPIPEGPDGSPNTERLIRSLNTGLRIPLDQIIQLSDSSKKNPVPPLKKVIEEGISNFLKTCRKQDRILLFFVGHTKEIDNEAYLVPLEGELDNTKTLIPLKWVYTQLGACPARQKVLIIDGNRFNSSQGEERPASGPMGAKAAESLSKPPAGIQVWSACSAGQLSYEFEEAPLGLFLNSFRLALTPEKEMKGALEGRIQKHDDLIPMEDIHTFVKGFMSDRLQRRKLKQIPILAGTPPAEGAEFDPSEATAQLPALPVVKASDLRVVKDIMNDISLPPLKGGEFNSQDVSFAILPPFPAATLKAYDNAELPAGSKLKKAIQDARALLWAISTAKPPEELKTEVMAIKSRIPDLSIMKDKYGHPGEGPAETRFKERVFEDSKSMSKIVARMEVALDSLKEVSEEVETAPKRWQANYKFVLGRFQAQLAYLEEYQGLLGQMRKELPPINKDVETGWKMASKEKLGDGQGKRYHKQARKLYEDLAKENPDTPWEVLGKREKLTALGLEWQAY